MRFPRKRAKRAMTIRFEYGEECISNIKVVMKKTTKKKEVPTELHIKGTALAPSRRLWKSMQMRFRFNDNIFKYFPPEEVFQRIAKVNPKSRVKYCIEKIDGAKPRLLAVTNPESPIINYPNLCEILSKHGYENINYADGVVRSTHSTTNPWNFKVAGDDFVNRFIVDTPIDGFGRPQIYLSLLRQVCKNGAVGFNPAFRSELVVGKQNDCMEYSLIRALESYNNEDGFIALKERFESSAKSWASVKEAMKLQNLVVKLHGEKQLKLGSTDIVKTDGNKRILLVNKLSEVTGNLNQIYGLANIDALSQKKQRTLPAGCKVYDLINFASEIATHSSTAYGGRQLQAYIGDLVTDEYDLEGTCDLYGDYKDFFVNNAQTAETLSGMNKMFSDN